MFGFIQRILRGRNTQNKWQFDFGGPLPVVAPRHYSAVEGSMSERGDWLAEAFFRAVFDGDYEYCAPWDAVRRRYGCFKVADAHQWTRGTNEIIAVLNTLPRPCSRADLIEAFGL
jgi:hypothetical protein